MSAREHLITAAKELLWERGYEAMSPRAIQERSGAGQGSFYHHFASKADLATTALGEVAAEMQETFNAALHTNKPPLERVRDYLRQPREALRGCRLGRITQEQALSLDPLRHFISSYFLYCKQEIAAALEQAQREGTISATIDAADVATTLIAVVQGGYVLARASQDPQQMDQAIHGALALLDTIERR
ncbi:MAG: TetR/AcrR family transcriptional regulator [Ktedonobacteraceae bacterium]|nr:TetR/AcrR family transcriptional regulator [Ktedonobacteraceae bacterium]